MKKLMAVLSFMASLFLICAPVFADYNNDAAGACGVAACGGFIFFIIAIFVINILILAWVAKDAKARGMGSPIGWLILVFFTGIIGLIIYLIARPAGEVEPCPNCSNKRLKAMAKCPHCGN